MSRKTPPDARPPDAPKIRRPGWDALVVVCRACGKRSSGPEELRPKAVARELKAGLRELGKPRPRVVATGCLGLCPRGAIAIARVGGERPAAIAAVATLEQARTALRAISGAVPDAPPQRSV